MTDGRSPPGRLDSSMNEELYDALDVLNICIYTLMDGTKVIGEEIDYDHTHGLITMYGVLEFREKDHKPFLIPYVPENVNAEFVFTERNTLARSVASKPLKETYFLAILAIHPLLMEEPTDTKPPDTGSSSWGTDDWTFRN